MRAFLGILTFILIAYLMSENKNKISKKLVFYGIFLQILFAYLILKTSFGRGFFESANLIVTKILKFSDQGAIVLFGEGFREHFFAFSVLPTIIFISALMSIAFHLGIMQKIVEWMARFLAHFMDLSGAESLSACANIFVGQSEAPLIIKPYLNTMTRSEVMAMMTGGMATIAGGVMAAYVGFGADAGHLLAASVMSAPASLVFAKILVPETELSLTKGKVEIQLKKESINIFDATCRGVSDGLNLALNVGAMLMAFTSLVLLLNHFFTWIPSWNGEAWTLERILSFPFYPVAWLIGIPEVDLAKAAQILGKRVVLNEFIAYIELGKMKDTLHPKTFHLMTYALCGFANFASIAIQIAGIGSLIPGRRKDLSQLGFRAMLGGLMACFLTASIAGFFMDS